MAQNNLWQKAEKFLSKDKYLGPFVKKFGPCKITPRPKKNYFEDLVDGIASQQLSGKAARTIFSRLKEKCGGQVTPEKLRQLKTEDIRKCGLSYAKSAYVKDLAEHVIKGKLKVKKLDQLSDEEIRKELVAVKGIGNWTADMFLMFTLARADIFPTEDLGIKNGMKKLLGKEMKPKEMAEFSKRWQPYRTVASWYLWASLDNQ